MVQTRSSSSTMVPRLSPPPPLSPTKRRSIRSTSATPAPTSGDVAQPPTLWHAPSAVALAWLAISLPLVGWDTGYVMLRPHSMPGGKWHFPWKPYDLYGRVDHVYGVKHWESGAGFCGAQGTMNVVETVMYLTYLWIWYSNKKPVGTTASGEPRTAITGKPAAVALLIMFSACIMTLSKTALYWLNESWSGFDNIGHNTTRDIVFLWVIPNGLWLIFPSYLVYTYGREILNSMTATSARSDKTE